MARKGENIYKRKDGRWEARYEKGRNSKGQIIYGSLYGKSYREVREKKINSIVKLPVAKTISPSESMNICDVSTRWLESIRHTVKESTYSCYLTLIQKHILTYFNNSSMITSEHIQQFINYKITNDLSPTSVRNIVVLLERILRYGEDENLLPVTKRSFTFPKSSFYINDTLDASQLSILARYLYLEGDAFSVGLLLCMHTGIRIGELCGLKGGDFNFTNETFEIHRTISRIRNTESTPEHQDAKTKVIIGTPKSTSSLRTIPVPRKSLGLNNEFVLIHTGRFIDQKNQGFVLDIFREIKKQYSCVKLIFLGAGDLLKKIEDEAQKLGLQKDVLFLGVKPNVEDYLCAADCYVMPSLYEGLPVAAIEAQCSGLPSIMSTNITNEVALTDNAKQISLDMPLSEWSEKILEYKDVPRVDGSQIVAENGYDVHLVAKWLEGYYLSKTNGE